MAHKHFPHLFSPIKLAEGLELKNRIVMAPMGIPVIVVGGIASLPDIRQIVGEGKADAISMSRPFVIEPGIVKKFQEGKQDRSKCIQCNFCVIAAETRPLRCYHGKLKE